MVNTRFAPSPTGQMHVGNMRTCLMNFLYAKHFNGKFILRIDDTDNSRNIDQATQSIIDDLAWLGINPCYTFKQSDQQEIYNSYIKQLKQDGLLYPCYETAEELEITKQQKIKAKLAPIYDRKCFNLCPNLKKAYQAQNRKPYYRFYLGDKGKVQWHDKIKGPISFDIKNLSDPVVVKTNGQITYMLSSVIDDIQHSITDIIRGQDHVSNTAIQIVMFQKLNAHIPSFAHLSLVSFNDQKLSKRIGGFTLNELKRNFLSEAVLNLLYTIGTCKTNQTLHTQNTMIKNFAIENYNSSTSQYQPNQLKQINACLLSQMNYTQISNILVKEQSNILLTPNMWEIIKNNVSNFDDIKMWNHILYNQPNITNKLSQDDKTYLNKILSFLPENIIQGSWKQWTQTINQNLQIKGKKLFLPIRIALTGLTHGPPMEDIILLLGKEQVQKRIKKCLN